MTKKQAEEIFRHDILPMLKACSFWEQNGRVDYVGRTEAWNNWVDAMCQDGQVTAIQRDTWVPPKCCG